MNIKQIITQILKKHPIQHASNCFKQHEGLVNAIHEQTQFLDPNSSLSERVWNIMNDRQTKNVCSYGNPTNFDCFPKGYRPFCSNGNGCNCKKDHDRQKIKQRYAQKSSDEKEKIKQKRKETNKKLFGTEYALQNKELLEKAQKTTKERYGTKQEQKELFGQKIKAAWLEKYNVDHISQLETVKDKKKQSSLEKYGTENPMMNKTIQQKAAQTLKTNHGVTVPSRVSHFKEKTEHTCFERYGVNNPSKIQTIKDKKVHNSLIKYGCENPAQSSVVKEKTRLTNIMKYGYDSPQQSHIPLSVYTDLNSKAWLEHELLTRSIKEIAYQFQIDPNVVRRYIKTHNLKLKSKSSYEHNFEHIIHDWNVNYIRNSRSILSSGLELDMFFPDHMVAVEINGLYWHSDVFKDNNYHSHKLYECIERGIRLITIFEDEWVMRKEQCLLFIKNILQIGVQEKIHARKCSICEVDFKTVKPILDMNHIQGYPSSSQKNIVLLHDNKIVSVMCFSHPRGNTDVSVWELTRFCNNACKVVGGAGRLLQYFKKTYCPESIISFADRRWSVGDLYNTLGFTLDGIIKPDYSYIKNLHRLHKTNFSKQKLKRFGLTSEYIASKTEKQLTTELGYKRIYDCGKMRFVWRK